MPSPPSLCAQHAEPIPLPCSSCVGFLVPPLLHAQQAAQLPGLPGTHAMWAAQHHPITCAEWVAWLPLFLSCMGCMGCLALRSSSSHPHCTCITLCSSWLCMPCRKCPSTSHSTAQPAWLYPCTSYISTWSFFPGCTHPARAVRAAQFPSLPYVQLRHSRLLRASRAEATGDVEE